MIAKLVLARRCAILPWHRITTGHFLKWSRHMHGSSVNTHAFGGGGCAFAFRCLDSTIYCLSDLVGSPAETFTHYEANVY